MKYMWIIYKISPLVFNRLKLIAKLKLIINCLNISIIINSPKISKIPWPDGFTEGLRFCDWTRNVTVSKQINFLWNKRFPPKSVQQ